MSDNLIELLGRLSREVQHTVAYKKLLIRAVDTLKVGAASGMVPLQETKDLLRDIESILKEKP